MLKWWMRLAWFISSYTPLWIILALCNIPILVENPYNHLIEKDGSLLLLLIFCALVLLSNLIVFGFLIRNKRRKGEKVEIDKPKVISELSKEYIVTYAISLIGFNLMDWRQAASFAFLIAFFGFLYVKYNDITYNPMLDCFGFRLFNADIIHITKPKTSDGNYYVSLDVTLITQKKKRELNEDAIHISTIGEGIFTEVSH